MLDVSNILRGDILMNLSSSLEDYLEAIYDIKKKDDIVRITDISKKLKVEKSSVNTAVNKLKNLDLVIHEKYADIILTEKGKKKAANIRAKHDVLLSFLTDVLGLKKNESEKEACKIEHIISDDTFEKLSEFVKAFNKKIFF